MANKIFVMIVVPLASRDGTRMSVPVSLDMATVAKRSTSEFMAL